MSGHNLVHKAPGVSLRTHVLNAHEALIRKWRIAKRQDAIAAALFAGGRRIWVTEEAARHGRRRSLIDDNPASG